VDDIWIDTKTNKLIIVDYKSQAKINSVSTEEYLSDAYHEGYKIQMDFYSYLLNEMNVGHSVAPISYFYVCNADRNASSFDSKLVFEETLNRPIEFLLFLGFLGILI
jgi:ATP-dependent helicase/DNAse subunit B